MGCRPGPTYTVSSVDTVCATAKAHASGAPGGCEKKKPRVRATKMVACPPMESCR